MSPFSESGSPVAVADRLLEVVVGHLEAFSTRYAPRFELPSVFAGFPVGSDVRADLAFALGLVHADGVSAVGGVEIEDAVVTVLGALDGDQTHTFFSYRVAETLARFGGFTKGGILRDASEETRRNLEVACDSTSWIELLDHGLPANFATVLTRCELARRALGLERDPSVLADLLDRSRRLISTNERGYIDDSENGTDARYDIYSVDVYLFTADFADQLGPAWSRGVRNVGDLVASVASRNGAAMTWGRSLGVLAVCHTIELAALLLERNLTDDRAGWIARLWNACEQFGAWTDGALVTSHRRRAQDSYRGPDRWLQTTFDCLGKLAWAAHRLRRIDRFDVDECAEPFKPRDELVRFETDRAAAVWSYRSAATAFALPFIGTPWADYLPGPRNPGLYEVPVDAPLPTLVPTITAGDERYVGGGLPIAIDHRSGCVEATWEGFPPLAAGSRHAPLDGRRTMSARVDRHAIQVHERLQFPSAPQSVSLQIAETHNRPLRLHVETDAAHRVDVIDTDGLASYRSFWSELPRVHQIDIAPGTRVDFTWSVQPLVRIATADPAHHYHRSLYDPLAKDVAESSFGAHLIHRPDSARERLDQIDAFHLHWPEWFVDTPEQADVFIGLLDQTRTTLIWTQHNLRPHRDVERADELYQRFAAAARLVIHHSVWGRDEILARYRFRRDADHVVLPHGHFGTLIETSGSTRSDVEHDLELRPGATRIGIVGAPRREKQVQEFMDAFARTSRDDLELLVLSLDSEEVPDDPRIVARPYEFIDRDEYNRRLVALDAIALPFDPDGEMLTTGVIGDVVGLGLPAIVSRWPYLTETLGAAGLVYEDHDRLVELLDSLTSADLDQAARESRALQDTLAWDHIAARFLDAVIDAGAIKS